MRYLSTFAALSLFVVPALARAADAPAAAAPGGDAPLGPVQAPNPESVERGHHTYQRYCQACHGAYGDSHGDSYDYLEVKPRDFTKGIYKFRSTVTGTLPVDSDLVRTLKYGLWGSGMPKWSGLGDDQLADVVAYIESFAPAFYNQGRGIPITIPAEPEDTQASRDNGKKVFNDSGCYNCHGQEGRGNGPSAATLVDDWGNSIKPLNFTAGHWKAGTPDELWTIYKDFMTGINGTPMPSYGDTMTPAQAWDLVHYLKTLINGNNWDKGYSPGEKGQTAMPTTQAETQPSAPMAAR